MAASLREARHDVYRRAILEAAEAVFAERGFDATKMQEVAARAGVSVGVLYEVFPGKDALLDAVHDERGAALLGRASALVDDRAPIDVLRAGVALLVGFFEDHPAYLRMQLRDGVAWSHPELANGLDLRTWRDAIELLQLPFEAGRLDGSLVDDDPAASSRLVMALIQTCLADWTMSEPRAPKEAVIARLDTLLIRNFARTT